MTKQLSGQAVEKLASAWLKKKYPDALIEGPPIRTRYQRRDYFGLADYLVYFPGEWVNVNLNRHTDTLMLVQVSKKYLSQKSKEFKERWASWPGSKLYLRFKDGEWFLK